MRPQKISERLEEVLFLTRTNPTSYPVRIWQFLHGSRLVAVLSVATVIVSFGSSLHYGTDLNELEVLFFFCAALCLYAEAMDFWTTKRRRLETVTIGLIEVAKAIERVSSPELLLKMEKTAHTSKLIVISYSIDCFLILVLFMVYPLQHGNLALDIPYLSHDKHVYYVLWGLEEVLLAVGALVYCSSLTYFIEVSMLLSCLYDILSANFEEDKVSSCIRIHQSLVDVSLMFQAVLSRSLSTFAWCSTPLIIEITCLVLLSENPEPMFIVALGTCFVAYYGACVLSDLVAVSYESVATGIYRSGWTERNPLTQRDLFLVILVSQKTLSWKAGIIGKLKKGHFTTVINRWYQSVHALLSLN